MGLVGTLGRIGAAIGTGGLSEAYRAINGGQFGPHQADTSGIKEAQNKAFGVSDQYGGQAQGYQGQYNRPVGGPLVPSGTFSMVANPNGTRSLVAPGGYDANGNWIPTPGATPMGAGAAGAGAPMGAADRLQAMQFGALNQLGAAAAGKVPSPAELQLQQQSARNMASQFGLAAALQGRSPGMALRNATQGAAQIQGQTNQDAATLRAQEEANARNAYIQALQGSYGQQLQQRGLDINQQQGLTQAQLQALGIGTQAGIGNANASAANAASQNAFTGQILGTGAQLAGLAFKSDRRAKTAIKRTGLVKLARALDGYTYRYKDAKDGDGDRVGIMAQDALKGGKAGRSLVRNIGGKLHIDVGNAVGAALAMSAAALRKAA